MAAAEKRGWQVFGLAFLFRLQSYILSGGYSAASLLKVDILNVMGPAIALAAITGGWPPGKRHGRRSLWRRAVAISLLDTPRAHVTSLLDWLPDPVEWYFRPTPGRTNFTLFPWAGFVFAGAAVGEAIDGLKTPDRAAGFSSGSPRWGSGWPFLRTKRPSGPDLPRSEFWTSSPTYFFLRVGLLTALLPLGYAWEHLPWRHKLSSWSPLAELGKASLFVYWIHVEMVYGFFSRPIRRALSVEQASLPTCFSHCFSWASCA